MTEARKIFIVLFILLFSVGFGLAQQKPADDPLKLEADLVSVDIIATDAEGQFVRNLSKADFTIFEDAKPQSIDFFELGQRPEQLPLNAVFVLDASGSIEPELGQIQQQQNSARQFMSLLDRASRFAVIAFSYEVRALQDLTDNPQRIINAFSKATQVGGSSKIYDAVDRAVTMLKKSEKIRDKRRVRRVVILVTDGFDSASIIPVDELVRRANNASVTVYTITIPNYLPTGNGKAQRAITLLDLARLGPRTGGMDFPADSYDFTPIFKAIREELAASYTLAYYPPETSRRDGKFHEITVKTSRPGVTLRLSRQGYQAQR